MVFLGGACEWGSYLCPLTSLCFNRNQRVSLEEIGKRWRGSFPGKQVEWNHLGIWILLGFSYLFLSQNSDPRMKKALFLTEALVSTIYCHYLLSCWPIAERSPEHLAHLSTYWDLLCTLDNQEMKRIFVWAVGCSLFHKNVKFMWWWTKKSIQMRSKVHCLDLCFPWILLCVS